MAKKFQFFGRNLATSASCGPMRDDREHLLIRCAQGGDRAALAELWRTHRRWVAAILLAHKPVEADLDDLMQEVAIQLVGKIGTLRDPARLRPWMSALARNCAVSTGRKASSTRNRVLPLMGHDAADPGARVEDQVGARLATGRTLKAMESLTPEQRECLMLRGVRGMSQKAIAAHLDIPVTTVETRLAKGRRALRAALSESQSPARLRRRS